MTNTIIEKIHNLLQKTTDNGCTEAEAQEALLMAQKLMAKHHIELGQVTDIQKNQAEVIRKVTDCKAMTQWSHRLLHIIAENFRCKPFLQNNCAAFLGEKEDAAIAAEIFRMIESIMDKGCRKIRKQYRKEGRSTEGAADSYLHGFLTGLQKAFNEQKAQAEESFALILVTPESVILAEQEIRKNSKTVKGRNMKGNTDPEAYGQGFLDGKSSIRNPKAIEA